MQYKALLAVFPAICFLVTTKGMCYKYCIKKSMSQAKYLALTRVDARTFIHQRANTFVHLSSHHWNVKPTDSQAIIFLLQLIIHYIANPNIPFKVTQTTFSELRNMDKIEL
jgi:hypothetical protein